MLAKSVSSKKKAAAKKKPKSEKRNAEATRARILATAMEGFGSHGLEGARIENISKKAKVNKQAIYYHFKSKDKLFEASLRQVYSNSHHIHLLDDRDLPPTPYSDIHFSRMAWVIGEVYDHLLDASPSFSLIADENRMKGKHLKGAFASHLREATSPMMTLVVGSLQAGQNAGLFRKSINAEQFYVSIISLCMMFLINAYTFSTVVGFDLLSAS